MIENGLSLFNHQGEEKLVRGGVVTAADPSGIWSLCVHRQEAKSSSLSSHNPPFSIIQDPQAQMTLLTVGEYLHLN